jgi:hypothetical protein
MGWDYLVPWVILVVAVAIGLFLLPRLKGGG